jgi:hypothetical protein
LGNKGNNKNTEIEGDTAMNRKLIFLLTILLNILVGVGVCLASPSVYDCLIKSEYRLDDKGEVAPVSKDIATSLGDRFTVDRDSGRIIGAHTDNKIAKEYRVIQQGDSNRTFVAMSSYWGGTTDYLQVNEFVRSPDKPFVLVFKGFWIHAGICR